VPEINRTVIPNGCVLRSPGHRSLQGGQALRACCCYPVLSGTAAAASRPQAGRCRSRQHDRENLCPRARAPARAGQDWT